MSFQLIRRRTYLKLSAFWASRLAGHLLFAALVLLVLGTVFGLIQVRSVQTVVERQPAVVGSNCSAAVETPEGCRGQLNRLLRYATPEQLSRIRGVALRGPAGRNGTDGAAGAAGKNGTNGTSGRDGRDGVSIRGSRGPQGTPGKENGTAPPF